MFGLNVHCRTGILRTKLRGIGFGRMWILGIYRNWTVGKIGKKNHGYALKGSCLELRIILDLFKMWSYVVCRHQGRSMIEMIL